MMYAGEDPGFILRRLCILAGEDVGLADPMGLVVAEAAAAAFDRIGLPEGIYPLVEATLYLATAPKSNSAMAYFKALKLVEKEGRTEVPDHLKDPSRDSRGLGHGKGYLYPHDYPNHHVAQAYLPEGLEGERFFRPSAGGYEAKVAARLARWRRAKEKMLRQPPPGGKGTPGEPPSK